MLWAHHVRSVLGVHLEAIGVDVQARWQALVLLVSQANSSPRRVPGSAWRVQAATPASDLGVEAACLGLVSNSRLW